MAFRPRDVRLPEHLIDGSMGAALGSEPVRVLTEVRFIKGRQHLADRLLDHTIQYRRYSELAEFPASFGDLDAPHRRWAV